MLHLQSLRQTTLNNAQVWSREFDFNQLASAKPAGASRFIPTHIENMFNKLLTSAKSILFQVFPALGLVDAAKDLISEAVAQKIRDAAIAKGQAMLAKAHHDVVKSIIVQNAVLLLSLAPVYVLRSPWPFYIAYAGVLAYNAHSAWTMRSSIGRLFASRSLTKTIADEVESAIQQELTQREFYERKAVAWLGPDIRKLSEDIAIKMRPDVMAGAINMGFTMLASSIAFRVFIIPALEHKALTGFSG